MEIVECATASVDDTEKLEPELSDLTDKPLSKRQQKLMKRRQEQLRLKSERRIQRKEKRKEKHRLKVASGMDLGPSRKLLKRNTMKDSKCQVSVVIDLSFDDLMTDKDINKLGQQIQYCYSRNRRAAEPLQLYFTSLGAKTRKRLETVGDYNSWDVHISSDSYSSFFDVNRITYLTSDSPNVLTTLDSGSVYVIGGLVDHNHHKGLCYDLACKRGINHARLPIDEYCKLNTRRVLTINHVFEILLRFTENNSWLDSFYQVIPKRKQVAASGKPSNDADDVGDATESRDQVGSDSDVSLKYTGAEGTQPVIASEVSDRASSSCGYVVDKPVSNCDNSGLSLTPHCADEIQQKLDL